MALVGFFKENWREIAYALTIIVLAWLLKEKTRKLADTEMVLEQCSQRYYQEIGKD